MVPPTDEVLNRVMIIMARFISRHHRIAGRRRTTLRLRMRPHHLFQLEVGEATSPNETTSADKFAAYLLGA